MTYVKNKTIQIMLITFQRKIKSVNRDHAQPSLILRGNAVTEAESNLCESALILSE